MTLKLMIVISILAGGGHCAPDTARLHDVGDFDSQLDRILHDVRITPEAMDSIIQVYNDVGKLMQQLWPESEVKAFGATASGLGTRLSDVDLLVDLPNTNLTIEQCAQTAKAYLETYPQIFTNIEAVVIPTETFLKCQHVPTKQDVDLTFTKPGCVRETALVRYYLEMDKRASDLAMFLKYWSKQHHLIGLYWMPSFSIAIQVIFYLQQKGIVPSVLDLQRNSESVIINNWETGFNENLDYKSNNNDTLYELLGGFFEYYSTFDYDKYMISLYVGRPLRRDLFENVDNVPDEFQLYKHNVRWNLTKPLKLNAKIILQDPFEHNNNSGEYVCIETVERIVAHLKSAAKMFKQRSSGDFLTSILDDVEQDSLVGEETSCWS